MLLLLLLPLLLGRRLIRRPLEHDGLPLGLFQLLLAQSQQAFGFRCNNGVR
jgi:hypothetical protein